MAEADFHGLRAHGLRLVLESARPLPAKGFHGSWLRGVLGHTLFRSVCIYPQPRCDGCALRGTCPYPQVFKPYLLGGDRLPAYLVHGWRVEGPRCVADVVLLGDADRCAETWIRGLDKHAGEMDLGGGGPGRLVAVQDLRSRRTVFADGAFRPGAMLTLLRPLPPPADGAILRLLTPLVSKHQRDSDPLLRPLRTRIQRLINDYGDGTRLDLAENPWRIPSLSGLLSPHRVHKVETGGGEGERP